MERYDITIQMYSADASGTQYVWEKVPAEEGDFVLYADAQATIAALQAQLKDMVLRNKILRDRLDLPPERCAFHDEVVSLQARVTGLEQWVQDQSTANLSQRY